MIDLFKFNAFEYMAAAQVKRRYSINRFELWLLMASIATIGLSGRMIINEDELFSEITGSYLLKRKMKGYLKGLKRLRLLAELDYNNRGSYKSLAVTELGMKVAKAFEDELLKIERKREVKGYDVEGIVLKEVPPKYRLLKPLDVPPDRVPEQS